MSDRNVSNEEYSEFLDFIEKYNRNREQKKNDRFLYQLYNKFVKKNNTKGN